MKSWYCNRWKICFSKIIIFSFKCALTLKIEEPLEIQRKKRIWNVLESSFISINMKSFMANVGKKVRLFSMLNFCFAKSDLRVWEDIWEKSGRKMNHIVGKTWNFFVFKSLEKRNHSVAKFVCASKPFCRNIDGKRFKVLIFNCMWGKSPQRCWHLKNLILQQILKNDVKN